MTNEQLAVLLESYRRKLSDALITDGCRKSEEAWGMIQATEKELCHAVDALRGIQRI